VAIPSQSFVLAAKEKRERLRTSNPASSHAEDYISLSLTKRNDEYLGPHPESRLMREDDDLGEGDDGVIARVNCLSLDLTLASQILPSTQVPRRELPWAKRPEKRRQIKFAKTCKISSPMRSYTLFYRQIHFSLISTREDVDEETQEWEQSQFKRSGLRPDANFSTPVATSVYKATPSAQLYRP
jgi:GC-rich sequence DNA-binding factor